jgi:hypothetical protein
MHPRNCFYGLLAMALLASGSGCGGPAKPVKVEGVVTLDGKPVKGATVTLFPQDGAAHSASGFTDPGGVFRLTTYSVGDGAIPGDYKVTVTVTEPIAYDGPPFESLSNEQIGREVIKIMAKAQQQGLGKRQPHKRGAESVPPRYGEVSQTPLKCKVPVDGRLMLELNRAGT